MGSRAVEVFESNETIFSFASDLSSSCAFESCRADKSGTLGSSSEGIEYKDLGLAS